MIPTTAQHEPKTASIASPPDYSARSTQWKLMVVVALAMTALMSLRWFFPHESWRWIVGGAPSNPVLLDDAEVARKDPDTRLPRTAPEPLTDIPGAFVLPKALEATDPALGAAASPEEVAPAPVSKGLPKLTKKQLDSVEDDAVFRGKEKEAWFAMLDGLRQATPEEIEKASEGKTGFVQLFEQPEYFRGRIVTLRGSIRSVRWEYAHENDLGITGYFECWMMPAGGPTSPVRIYFLELPQEFPRGENLREDVELHGYFFKRVVYVAKDTTRLAPVILAKSPIWTPPAARPATLPPNYLALGWIALGTFVVGCVAAWMMFRSTPEAPGEVSFAKRDLSPEDEEHMIRNSLDDLSRRS